MLTFQNTLFHLHRQVSLEWVVGEKLRYLYGKRFGLKIAWANGKEGDSVGVGPGTERVVEGNDPNGGHRRVCEGDMAHQQAIFEPNLFPYKYLNFSQTSHSTPTCLWRWNRQRSETSAYKIQTVGNYPEESIQYSEHSESFKSRTFCFVRDPTCCYCWHENILNDSRARLSHLNIRIL